MEAGSCATLHCVSDRLYQQPIAMRSKKPLSERMHLTLLTVIHYSTSFESTGLVNSRNDRGTPSFTGLY